MKADADIYHPALSSPAPSVNTVVIQPPNNQDGLKLQMQCLASIEARRGNAFIKLKHVRLLVTLS